MGQSVLPFGGSDHLLSELERKPLQPQFPDLSKEVVEIDKLQETKIFKRIILNTPLPKILPGHLVRCVHAVKGTASLLLDLISSDIMCFPFSRGSGLCSLFYVIISSTPSACVCTRCYECAEEKAFVVACNWGATQKR